MYSLPQLCWYHSLLSHPISLWTQDFSISCNKQDSAGPWETALRPTNLGCFLSYYHSTSPLAWSLQCYSNCGFLWETLEVIPACTWGSQEVSNSHLTWDSPKHTWVFLLMCSPPKCTEKVTLSSSPQQEAGHAINSWARTFPPHILTSSAVYSIYGQSFKLCSGIKLGWWENPTFSFESCISKLLSPCEFI